jgi:hypothetical protein
MLLLLIILLFVLPFGGSYYNNGQYRPFGYGLGFVLLIIVIFLLLGGGGLSLPRIGCH